MFTLRIALNSSLIRNHLIIKNKAIVSSLLNNEFQNDRQLLDKNNDCFPIVISKRFGRRYRKWYQWPNDFLPFYWQRQRRTPGHLDSGINHLEIIDFNEYSIQWLVQAMKSKTSGRGIRKHLHSKHSIVKN